MSDATNAHGGEVRADVDLRVELAGIPLRNPVLTA